jgi:Raf kinase inhibitor-like YbhB/YbcL family protein
MRGLLMSMSLAVVAVAGASARADEPARGDRAATRVAPIDVRSPAFSNGGEIPRTYTCDGAELHPPLAWSQVPRDTRSIAILVEDLEGPNGPTMNWLVTGISPQARQLPADAELPTGAFPAIDSEGSTGWLGPCPESGRHHFAFHVYALDIPLSRAMSRADFQSVIDHHAIATGEIVGVYERDGDRDHDIR